MCGLSGIINLHNKQVDPAIIHGMSNCMAHRGPDADGFYIKHEVALGHRRLSIIDLSAAANQPMFSSDGRYCIVFNGEVYNFDELKQHLYDKGASLKTTSDTEVILERRLALSRAHSKTGSRIAAGVSFGSLAGRDGG